MLCRSIVSLVHACMRCGHNFAEDTNNFAEGQNYWYRGEPAESLSETEQQTVCAD